MTVQAENGANAQTSESWSRDAIRGGWFIAAIGILFRAGRYWHWRSLWLDEIYLAQSISTRGYHDLLFKPLEAWQAAPPGFLLLVRIVTGIFGNGERAMRFWPFVFGVLSLTLFLGVIKRVTQPRAGLIAMALMSVL